MEYAVPSDVMDYVERSGSGMSQGLTGRMISTLSRSKRPVDKKKLPDPIDCIKEVMAQRGLRNRDMKVYIGSSGSVSSILNRKKPLSIRIIRNLNKYLGISAEILIQPYDCH